MNNTLIIVIVVVIVLLSGIALLGVLGGRDKKRQPSYPQRRREQAPAERKEPSFSGGRQPEAQDAAVAADAPAAEEEGEGQAKVVVVKEAAAAVAAPQPELPLTFTPPELPPPDEALRHDTSYFYLIYFYAEAPLPPAALQPLLESLKRYRILLYKILGYSEKEGQWKEEKVDNLRYWLLALPLANRGGRLDKAKLDLIEEESRRFAQKLKIHVRFPSRSVAEHNGQVLDDFCNSVDLMIELRIILPQRESLSRIHELLTMHDMTPKEKKYVYRVNSEVFFLAQYVELPESTTQSLNFFMDTPKISKPTRAFDDMIDRLKKIAVLLNGSIIDPVGKPVDEARIEEIHQQLARLLRLMNEKGVTPGGSLAHLLFF